MPEGGIAGGANVAVRQAIGRYFVIPTTAAATTSTTPVVAASTSNAGGTADTQVGDGAGDGGSIAGRKRSHSSSGGTADTPSSAGDRWRERRGYV